MNIKITRKIGLFVSQLVPEKNVGRVKLLSQKKIGTGLNVCLTRGTNVSIRHLYCCFEQFQSLL